ncbi:MAG: 4Fe-4S dicluster domain-containing protein [Thermoanaerobaculaceae bacterium]|nr:4Fe-4S dicluster domain-containing protein [Thermoanaerobaculaceae bacterium]MDI9620407.1 [Fe-Fe] hydrogenase large subunit C-terminal domain-containing protein [Acidobacteriota bacterium]NLH12367.1 4Fe-4S dicluster domain-containing protein [Holophagae bacterium]HPW55105.1 [Fe-Fe] hydrogenase large subunit C-terminal domain-containing protein [Thermoanaerobaculaceae bacterium]
MARLSHVPLVTTVKERCRVCYTCVRECPAKAIRIAGWQAEVVPGRCIGCGNCVRVCSQKAKQVASSEAAVQALLASGERVAACVAPSFPAEFVELDAKVLVGMLRRLGFALVNEVAFGADLVARRYRQLLADNPDRCYISTSCPAIVTFVERYYPSLVDFLAPVASPMVATARALRQVHGPELKTVFIGPCVAKKGEELDTGLSPEIDEVLTFAELRQMLAAAGIHPEETEASEFDPPHGGTGALFPLSRGALQAASIDENLILGDIVAADGRTSFVEVIKEFESGDLDLNARLLDLLCCNGCIMGAGMTSEVPLFRRRAVVSKYVRQHLAASHPHDHQAWLDRFANLDLGRTFVADDQRLPTPSSTEITEVLERMGKHTPADELNCGACGYDTCREHAVAVCKGLAESEMCLPFTIEALRTSVGELALSHEELRNTQQALMHSERLASMGQLAAGIAHEVNNPLGVVLLYAHMILEEAPKDAPGRKDLEMIVAQADRCKKIVSGLLNFARQNKVFLQETLIRDLVLQGVRSVPIPDHVRVRVEHDEPELAAEIDRDQVMQVLTNLISNAIEAMPEGGTLTLSSRTAKESVLLTVADTGVGISKENMNKVFEPFFTTKPMGKGTGLGLPVIYGIVKMHRGDIKVESNADPAVGPTGTSFTVTLPRAGRRE